MGYNLLTNGIYWGYDPLILTFLLIPGTSKKIFFGSFNPTSPLQEPSEKLKTARNFLISVFFFVFVLELNWLVFFSVSFFGPKLILMSLLTWFPVQILLMEEIRITSWSGQHPVNLMSSSWVTTLEHGQWDPGLPRLNIYWLNVLNMSIGCFILFSLSARNPSTFEGYRGFVGWNGGKNVRVWAPEITLHKSNISHPNGKRRTIFKKCLG